MESDSDDNLPVSLYISKLRKPESSQPVLNQHCEAFNCLVEVFSSCHLCLILLCYDHFLEEVTSCALHGKSDKSSFPDVLSPVISSTQCLIMDRTPEEYSVEGSRREHDIIRNVTNKKKLASKLRMEGKEYTSYYTNKKIPAKTLKEHGICNALQCRKIGKCCDEFNRLDRENIFKAYWSLSSTQLKREYITRYCSRSETKQKTKGRQHSRRKNSFKYFLPLKGVAKKVCKKFFLRTLSISEKVVITSNKKVRDTGVLEKDNRGGRSSCQKLRDAKIYKDVKLHIERFPREESHYCRKFSKREYLHGDLSLSIMYDMYKNEIEGREVASYSTYYKIFKSFNLSFNRPKKDQCSLCLHYREAEDSEKEKLQERFTTHIKEKEKIRDIKDKCKNDSQNHPKVISAVFDLQQVIYLPISNNSKVFYKNRLSNYNFTIYNLGTKGCNCFVWHEAESKRGSSEISTAVYLFLQENDKSGIQTVNLFCDGCAGQAKNTIMVSMLLYFIAKSVYIDEVFLRFFEPYHGQNEGDSAHSAISYALKKCGEIFTPSQLIPIIRLARKKHPYTVNQLNYFDFKNFKKLSQEIRLLNIRTDDQKEKINWTKIKEVKISKQNLQKVYFKSCHNTDTYRSLTLKRNICLPDIPLTSLNTSPNKISAEKYRDLNSFCTSDMPVIRNLEHKIFFQNLPFQN